MKRISGIVAALAVMTLLLLAGCAKKTETLTYLTPTPTAEILSLDEDEAISLVAITPTPAPTPVPTPTPEPDPLFGTWSGADGALTFSLSSNGYAVAYGDETYTGTYQATADRLLFTETGTTLSVGYATDGETLTLTQPGQEDLVLTKESQGSGELLLTDAPAAQPFGVAMLYARQGVVTVEIAGDTPAEAYCFTSVEKQPADDSVDWTAAPQEQAFTVYKSDGTFYLWVRGADGTVAGPYAITVDSGYHYIIKAEGLKALSTGLDGYLAERDSSVDALNSAIYQDVAAAGVYTRAGVVTAGVSLISHLSEYGASVVYQGHGSYQKEDNWGVNPDWGSKLKNPTSDGNGTYYYTGMQCVAAIVWAYKHGGVNLSNGVGSAIGTLGESAKKGDNKIKYNEARSGDIVKQNGHYLMVVDRLDTDGDGEDDSYLTYEMNAPHLTFLQLTFRQVRYREFFSMDAVFENEGRNRKKANYWEDTFFIPEEAMPEEMRTAVVAGRTSRAVDRLLRVLGDPDGIY